MVGMGWTLLHRDKGRHVFNNDDDDEDESLAP